MDMVVVLPFFKERYSSGGDLRPLDASYSQLAGPAVFWSGPTAILYDLLYEDFLKNSWSEENGFHDLVDAKHEKTLRVEDDWNLARLNSNSPQQQMREDT